MEKQNHQHGGSPQQDFKRLGVVPRPVKDFSVNINPLGPPREVMDAWGGLSKTLISYPSIDGDGVRQFYEKRFNLPRECVLPGNGSIEIIYLAPRALRLKKVMILSPCFHDYERAARLAGADIVSIPIDVDNWFGAVSPEDLEDRFGEADALCIGNPNNPTGTVFSRNFLLYLADKYPDKWFLVDEAFVQFVDEAEKITLMDRGLIRRNLLVFHSLTKFYALPGLRLGAAIGHPDTISRLANKKEPWAINGVAEKTAQILVDCFEYEKRTREIIFAERQRMAICLNALPGLSVFPATANFFLAQWKGTGDLDDLLRRILSKGLYVRDCRNFTGLEDNFFRFGIGMPEDNDLLMNAFASCIPNVA